MFRENFNTNALLRENLFPAYTVISLSLKFRLNVIVNTGPGNSLIKQMSLWRCSSAIFVSMTLVES